MSEHKPFKPPMPTAPQPEVLPRETNAIMEALEIRESELLDRIAALEAQLAEAQRRADEYEERWLGYPKAEEAKVKRLQELRRKRAAEEFTPEEDVEYAQLLEVVRSFSPRMNDLFAPVGSLTTEEIIDKLLAASGPDTLAGRYRTLREMYADAQAKADEGRECLEENKRLLADTRWLWARVMGDLPGPPPHDIACSEIAEKFAEAQARLAMAVEAIEECDYHIRSTSRGEILLPWQKFQKGWYQGIAFALAEMEETIKPALTATAPAAAEFVQKVERRGAANELRRMVAHIRSLPDDPPGYFTKANLLGTANWLERRADELEGK